jgi:hypothetical protein
VNPPGPGFDELATRRIPARADEIAPQSEVGALTFVQDAG